MNGDKFIKTDNCEFLVSIIIPVYNTEKYLKKCIESAINQTYKHIEIILIDDGSTDNSPFICDEYAEKDIRVRVIHKENEGQSAARNKGIKVASGKYIAFLDSDDFYELDFIEKLIKKIDSKDIDVIYSPYVGKCEAGIEFSKYPTLFDMFYENLFLTRMVVSFIVSKSFIEKNSLFFSVGIIHEDEEWAFRLICCAKSHLIFVDRYYNYTVNENSVTRKPGFRNKISKLYICEKIENFKTTYMSDKQKQYLTYYCEKFLHSAIMLNCSYSEYRNFNKIIKTNEGLKKVVKKYCFLYYIYIYMFDNFLGKVGLDCVRKIKRIK